MSMPGVTVIIEDAKGHRSSRTIRRASERLRTLFERRFYAGTACASRQRVPLFTPYARGCTLWEYLVAQGM